MTRFAYLGVLLFVILGTLWLEFVVHTRVYQRWRRLLLSILPPAVLFIIWDLYAISQGHWWFDTTRITGVYFPGELPLDEVLFFLIIPLAAILTLEAVRGVRRWEVGDEPPGTVVDGVRVEDR